MQKTINFLMRVFLFLLIISISVNAQKDTVQLKEVQIYGSFSKKYNSGFSVKSIKDSLFLANTGLQEVLQKQANIYFKEYGNGMVSSITLRGSGAQHTAVYFNGIAINSVLNGQTDFNTIAVNNFNEIIVKKGSGSTTLGSGAIGGAINLVDLVFFKMEQKIKLYTSYGSYNTKNGAVQFQKSNSSWFMKYAVNFTASNNDYPYLKTNQKNKNGAYQKTHLKAVLGHRFKNNNPLEFFVTHSNNNRNLSGSLTASSFSKLIDKNTRLLLRYQVKNTGIKQQMDLAYLLESYRFYLYKNTDDFSFGKANTLLAKYHLSYNFTGKIQFFSGLEVKQITAKGSDIEYHQNKQSEFFLLSHFRIDDKLQFNASIRKGIASNFTIPFIYGLDIAYKIKRDFTIKTNFSTNYRLPTINDLYWNPGGNPNLKPENSLSYEIILAYKKSKFRFNSSFYVTKSKNLIQWQPVSGNFWQPINVQNVISKGISLETDYALKGLNFSLFYDFTESKDLKTNKQLIYIPYHKATFNTDYHLKKWSFSLTNQYNGKVFTTTTNTKTVSDYFLMHFRLNRKVPRYKANIGLKIRNVLNSYYETIAYRPMPNRNYQVYCTIQF